MPTKGFQGPLVVKGLIVKAITGLLREWGDFVCAHLDHADEYGESILYRMIKFGGYTEQGDSAHKILCEDMPLRLKHVDRAVKGLPKGERQVITAFFCAPLKDDGNVYTKRELAGLIGINSYNFNSYMGRAKKRLTVKLKLE